MASFKMMSSSTSDLSRRNSSSASSSPSIRSNLHLRRDPHAGDHSRISFGYGGGNDSTTVHDYGFASDSMDVDRRSNGDRNSVNNGGGRKSSSADDVWKEIVSGEEKKTVLKEEEGQEDEYMMTLEDFLAKAAEMDDGEIDVKSLPGDGYSFDYPMMMPQQKQDQLEMVEGSARRKRGRVMMVEAMDKAAAQRQKRMIKNRESAARSRERKQAYQVELETMAAKLERENEQLLKEIEEKTRERYKSLMEQLIPVDDDEKRKPTSSSSRSLSRSHSLEW